MSDEDPVVDSTSTPPKKQQHLLSVDPDGKVNIRFTMKAKMWAIMILVGTGALGTGGLEAVKIFALTTLGIENPVTQQVEISTPEVQEAVNAATAPILEAVTEIKASVQEATVVQERHEKGVHQKTIERQAVSEAKVESISGLVGESVTSQEVMQAQADNIEGTVLDLEDKVTELAESAEEAKVAADQDAAQIQKNSEDIRHVYDKATQIEGQVSLLVRELVDKPRTEAETEESGGGGL